MVKRICLVVVAAVLVCIGSGFIVIRLAQHGILGDSFTHDSLALFHPSDLNVPIWESNISAGEKRHWKFEPRLHYAGRYEVAMLFHTQIPDAIVPIADVIPNTQYSMECVTGGVKVFSRSGAGAIDAWSTNDESALILFYFKVPKDLSLNQQLSCQLTVADGPSEVVSDHEVRSVILRHSFVNL